jgi:hypothetical protein
MPIELRKASPVRLRSLELDERWLQDRVADDPSLLGLGDLQILRRERNQPRSGRIDFLMYDPDSETRYEIEIMLGTLDESHIIRTIEYWDIERQRYPTLEHRAVIVAEEITSRFFNVIRLLNRAVPIIALQLNPFRFGDSVVLHFTKVLDVYEVEEDTEAEPAEQTDRRYWEKQAKATSLAVVDRIVAMVPTTNGPPRVTYNKFHIAVGTTGYNFCWFHPRRSASHCHVEMRVGNETRDAIVEKLEEAGISAGLSRRNSIKLKVTTKELDENETIIKEAIVQAERWSQTRGDEA